MKNESRYQLNLYRLFLSILLVLNTLSTFSQINSYAIKFIPEAGLKIGSQSPAIGGQFDMVGGVLFNQKYFAGIGSGYCTNMGMGGHTVPLYADARIYFSKNPLLFKLKDNANDFQAGIQLGMQINHNPPFKTGFISAIEFLYRFDFIQIKNFKFPSFYSGLNLEYNYSKFKDEYRGYEIQDGYLKHIILNIKVSFDLPEIQLKKRKNDKT